MVSNVYIVNYEFKTSFFYRVNETAYAETDPWGRWKEAVEK